MSHDEDEDDFPEAIFRILLGIPRRGESKRANNIVDFMERADTSPLSFKAAIQAHRSCPSCGGSDGLLIGVLSNDPITPDHPNYGLIIVTAFDHSGGDDISSAIISTEVAKQFVNSLGEAIAHAEALHKKD